MKKTIWVPLLLAVAGCSLSAGTGDGGEGIAAVQPSQVTEQALRAAATDPMLVRFYEARAWAPAWNAGNSQKLVETLTGSVAHGLDPRLFLAGVREGQAPAEREAALSLAALAYAKALARGHVDPDQVHEIYEIPRPEVDVAAGLNQALEQDQLADWMASLAPQDGEYRALSEAYAAALRAQSGGPAAPIPAGDTIAPGASDPRMPAIEAALRIGNYLPAPAEGGPAAARSDTYGPELVAAVRRLQGASGLEADGRIDGPTLAILNRIGPDRLRILAVNLERRRWMPREAAPVRIDVNVADSTLAFWDQGQVVDRRRVVTGQPGDETPQLASPIYRLVAFPTWTVPKSIEEEEIAPRGEAYLARNNMERRDGMIVQRPGPTNSLGLVKFDMRNDHAIYLHDTPAKALFGEEDRHRSHGCVRVQDALGFARLVAERQGVTDEWEAALAKEDETFVALPREIPVRLFYHTAFPDGETVAFRADPYGWDDVVARALGYEVATRAHGSEHLSDVGP